MNKILKTILIGSIAVFGVGFLLVSPTNAQADGLVVEYWTGTEWLSLTGPIFSETNFLPGEDVTRLVRVTNNSGQPQRISTEAINYPGFSNPDNVPVGDLSRALSIIIREEGGSDLYGGSTGEKTLFDFYKKGETYLSDLPTGDTEEYEYEITFPSAKENEWQAATTTFDILIGFQGVEGKVSPGTPPLGGGVLGLTIQYEKPFYIGTTTAKITWSTSYKATSRVIYDTVAGKFDLNNLPNYGYAYSTIEQDTPAATNGTTSHEVWLTDLAPATTYYYRAISHASPPTISQERSFTTLGIAGAEIKEEITPAEEKIPAEEVVLAPTGEEEAEKPFVPEGAVSPEEGIVTVPPEERVLGEGWAPLLLASLGEIRETAWMVILATFCLVGLIVIGIREWELARKKKKR